MGWGHHINALLEIEQHARALRELIEEHSDTIPDAVLSALKEPLFAIADELHSYQRGIEARMTLTPDDSELAKKVAKPYRPDVWTPLPYRRGLLVKLDPPYELWKKIYQAESDERDDRPEISVYIFLDTDDEDRIHDVAHSTDELVDALGYDGPHDVEIQRGSFFRRSRAFLRRTVSSEEVRERLAKVERALELAGLEMRQAEVDDKTAEAVAKLLAALDGVDRAVVKAGSILLIKYLTPQGPVVLTRTLSQLEIRAWEKFPEIQANPEAALGALATAVETLSDSSTESMIEGHPN